MVVILIPMLEKLGTLSSRNYDSQLMRGSPGQLIVMDDPAFDPDMALPALDFDIPGLQISDSQGVHSSQSMMSIRNRSGSVSSHATSAIGIDLPSSSMYGGSYQLPNDPFGASNLQKHERPGHGDFDDEAHLFQDDMLFEFDADGEMRDIDADERKTRLAIFAPGGRLGSDLATSGPFREEHVDGPLPVIDGEDRIDPMDLDEVQILPDVEPFLMMAGGLQGSDRPQSQVTDVGQVYSEEGTSVSAEAKQKRYKPKARKTLQVDRNTELLNADLRTWQSEYLDSMMAGSLARMNKTAHAQAKKNAMSYVFGAGLNGVGAGIGLSQIPSPLVIFSGESLLSMVTEKPLTSVNYKAKKGTKHARGDNEEALGSSPKRSRHSDHEQESQGEIGRVFDDEAIIMDDGTEIGRDAAEAMIDYHSSAIMPWNVSQSLNSHQRGATSSLPSRFPSIGSRRLASASPLIGRGAPLPENLDQLDMLDDDQIMYGRDDNEEFENETLRKEDSQHPRMSSSQAEAAEFEVYGPAAQVDTQTAAASQWVRDVLDRESGNFFDYVSNTISEKYSDELAFEDDSEVDKHVTFEELFVPEINSKMVAAQAFYHVLSLATKNRVWVKQYVNKDVFEPFGEIQIGVVA